MTEMKRLFMMNLQRLRKEKGYSQESLAEVVEVSGNHIAAMEIGRRFPSEEVFQRIADVLEVEPYELLLDPDSMEAAQNKALLMKYTTFLMDGMKSQVSRFIKQTK